MSGARYQHCRLRVGQDVAVKVPGEARVGEVGVSIVSLLVRDELGWIFREQPVSDYGIDAHVEVVESGETRGRLLALQIKSGQSYFDETRDGEIVFRPSPRHVEYWLSHSLPVLVVLVDTERAEAWWQCVSRETVWSTGKGYKMSVPQHQRLGADSGLELAALADADSYTLGLRQLQAMASWMRVLEEGGRVLLEVEEWVNKSSGRASLQLTAWDADGEEFGSMNWPFLIFPWADYAVELPRLFPWAELSVEGESDYELYEAQCGVWDKEEGRYFFTEDYQEWRRGRTERGLRPCSDDGEVALWRLDVVLGPVGRGFLAVDGLLGDPALLRPLGPATDT